MKHTLLMLKGILEGFGTPMDFTGCVEDVTVIGDDIGHAITFLASKSKRNVRKGLVDLADLLKFVPDAIQKCKGSGPVLTKMKAALGALKHPIKLVIKIGKHLILNGVDILKEIVDSIYAWRNHQFEKFGLLIGHVLEMILIGAKNLMGALYDERALALSYSMPVEEEEGYELVHYKHRSTSFIIVIVLLSLFSLLILLFWTMRLFGKK